MNKKKIARQLHGPHSLPMVDLKTKLITFDDRMKQVRIIQKDSKGRPLGHIDFLDYKEDEGFYYLKKYRPNWLEILKTLW